MTQGEKSLTISQIYARGQEKLTEVGYRMGGTPDSLKRSTDLANRKYLDSLFFKTRFLSTTAADTSIELFGVKLKTPIFCSPMSGFNRLSKTALVEIATGLKNAGSLLMLGIGGSDELQSSIDTGVPVVKMIKPYRQIELIYQKLRDAESRGCAAVGMDIDHFHGAIRGDTVTMTELFAPQNSDSLRQLIASTKLPFIIKGVLSVEDAEETARIGAKAIIVSTHSSTAVDFALPSMLALPDIANAVGNKMTVLIDSGFKTGNDVVKALAMGARAVGLGNAILLGWGAGESREVENLVNQITTELKRTMAVTGCSSTSAVNRSIIVRVE